jgi:hypothetical protein
LSIPATYPAHDFSENRSVVFRDRAQKAETLNMARDKGQCGRFVTAIAPVAFLFFGIVATCSIALRT